MVKYKRPVPTYRGKNNNTLNFQYFVRFHRLFLNKEKSGPRVFVFVCLLWGSRRTGVEALCGLDARWGRLAQKKIILQGERNDSKGLQSNQTNTNQPGREKMRKIIIAIGEISRVVAFGGRKLRHVLVFSVGILHTCPIPQPRVAFVYFH